jgi:hypothetical protein
MVMIIALFGVATTSFLAAFTVGFAGGLFIEGVRWRFWR